MRTPLNVFAVALFIATLAFIAATAASEPPGQASRDFGTLSPDAPPETAQFSFLIGEWHCKTRNMRPDGTLHDGPDATWTGSYILDGWAIQDVWRKEGSPPGTNIRSFNPQTRKWDNRWLAAGTLQWKYFEAEKVGAPEARGTEGGDTEIGGTEVGGTEVGGTMVMSGEGVDAQSRPYLDRNTFYEIRARSWKWRKDWSYDGGETWIEGIAHIHCRTEVNEPSGRARRSSR